MRKISLVYFVFLVGCWLSLASCGKKMSNLQQTTTIWDMSSVQPIFHDTLKEVIYDMSITYKDNFNSGIMAVAFGEPGQYRLVFLNKAGPRLFDLSFTPDDMKVNSIIKALDKKILLNILEKDFRMLFDPIRVRKQKNYEDGLTHKRIVRLSPNKTYYYYLSEDNSIESVHRAKGKRSIVEMKLMYAEMNKPQSIQIQHNRIPLSLELKSL